MVGVPDVDQRTSTTLGPVDQATKGRVAATGDRSERVVIRLFVTVIVICNHRLLYM